MSTRRFTALDQAIATLDVLLRRALAMRVQPTAARASPADALAPDDLTEDERTLSAGLMRVNHAGEVGAQALYEGQAFTARREEIRRLLGTAAAEERDHLVWCRERLAELDSHPSVLDPAWYAGAFAIGALAGLAGDAWSLGFVAETERQVVHHLDGHLQRLPEGDARSRQILAQMREDEEHHGTRAAAAGGRALPPPVPDLMRAAARIMTFAAFRI